MSISIKNAVVALWGMARPLIMLSVILVYLAGALVAWGRGHPLRGAALAWGLAAGVLVVASIHYANEYADHETDALTTPTPFSGGSGVLPRGLVPRRVALWAAWAALALGLAVALAGLARGVLSPAALLALFLGAFGGWMYSLPPLALAWRGWGEADNAALGGIVLPLYGYAVQAGRVDWEVIVGCLPFALLVFANLLATTWPDRRADGRVGKRTLAARWPVSRLRLLYALAVAASFVLLPGLAGRTLPGPVALSGLLALPLALWGAWRYTRIESPHPTVYAMVGLLLAQMGGWALVVL
mgnify:CR=1 FL=1